MTYSWAGGGAVLTICTVLPSRELAAELVSTYVGHADTPTTATHLMLGPVGSSSGIQMIQHERLTPWENPRGCAYDHAHQLIAQLHTAGHDARVRLTELSFAELERVE